MHFAKERSLARAQYLDVCTAMNFRDDEYVSKVAMTLKRAYKAGGSRL